MIRPQRKIDENDIKIDTIEKVEAANKGYNSACEDWEKFLPDEEELIRIMQETSSLLNIKRVLAKAISKRLRGEK